LNSSESVPTLLHPGNDAPEAVEPATRRQLARESAALGWKLFHRENPLRLLVLSVYVGQVCAVYFYTLLGRYTGGDTGEHYSYVGAVVISMTYMTVGFNTDVPLTDKWQGTYWRLSRSGFSPYGVFLCRTAPMVVHGVALMILTAVVVGPLTEGVGAAMNLLRALPLMVVLTVLANFVGLAVVAPAIGTRYDVLTYNVATAVIQVFSLAYIPYGANAAVDTIGTVVPLRHGLGALRGWLDGGPWLGQLGLEAIVSAAWLVAGAFAYRFMDARGRRTGVAAFR